MLATKTSRVLAAFLGVLLLVMLLSTGALPALDGVQVLMRDWFVD